MNFIKEQCIKIPSQPCERKSYKKKKRNNNNSELLLQKVVLRATKS